MIERRRGLPILISAVWQLIGAEAGIPVDGIGLPSHFIVRVGGAEGVLVDPFHGGGLLSRDDCKAIVEHLNGDVTWSEAFLEPRTPGQIAQRVLNNLGGAYSRAGDFISMYRVTRLMGTLRPDLASPGLRQAQIAERLGASELAVDLYEGVLRKFKGSVEAEIAAERLVSIESAPRLLH